MVANAGQPSEQVEDQAIARHARAPSPATSRDQNVRSGAMVPAHAEKRLFDRHKTDAGDRAAVVLTAQCCASNKEGPTRSVPATVIWLQRQFVWSVLSVPSFTPRACRDLHPSPAGGGSARAQRAAGWGERSRTKLTPPGALRAPHSPQAGRDAARCIYAGQRRLWGQRHLWRERSSMGAGCGSGRRHPTPGNGGCRVVKPEKSCRRHPSLQANSRARPRPCTKYRDPVLRITAATPLSCETAISRF
jgi:hypothetical protein